MGFFHDDDLRRGYVLLVPDFDGVDLLDADMAAVETKVEGIEGRLVRMDEKLDRLIERR